MTYIFDRNNEEELRRNEFDVQKLKNFKDPDFVAHLFEFLVYFLNLDQSPNQSKLN
jgi:hypothetical protein